MKRSKSSLSTRNYCNILVSIALLLMLCYPITFAQATTIDFSDDFNDSDYSGWTVHYGVFEVDSSPQKRLVGTDSDNMIYHESSRAFGTWLFEVYENSENDGDYIDVQFISNALESVDFVGYSLMIAFGPPQPSITIGRWNYSAMFDRSARFNLHTLFLGEEEYSGWFSYGVTRTENGNFLITRNGELIISLLYDDYETYEFPEPLAQSQYFVFRCKHGGALDNVFVGENITDTSSTTTSTTTSTTSSTTPTSGSNASDPVTLPPDLYSNIVIVSGIGIVILVIVIVFMKQRT